MNTSSLFMLIPFLIVAFITGFTVLRKRKQLEGTRHIHREPRFELESTSNIHPQDDFDIVPVKKLPTITMNDPFQMGAVAKAQKENDIAIASAPQASVSNNKQVYNDLIIVIHAIADPEKPYAGYELLQAMLTAGLRYGKMNIFHRHEEMNGRGNILFSVASMVEPGTFEMNKMGGFSTPGLVLFMKTMHIQDPLKAFEILQNTAQQLIDDLGGEVCDEKRRPLTSEKIGQWRSQILGGEEINA